MKKLIIICLMLLSLYQLKAQEQFGLAIFSVPAGWQMTSSKGAVTLEKAVKKGVVCKIIITSTVEGAVTTEAAYLNGRKLYGGRAVNYQKNAASKYEGEGLVSFFSIGSASQGPVPVKSYFYSLSNGSKTFYYQLLTSNNECIEEFNAFTQSLYMESASAAEPKANTVNARARKAAPAAPAAPAPMM